MSFSYAESLISRFQTNGVLVDTNLLLLYAIGKYDQGIVKRGSFNRIAAYTYEDFKLLCGVMSLFRDYFTTAYVFTELTNWIGQLPQDHEIACLQNFPQTFSTFIELPFDSHELSREPYFAYLGLTDAALVRVAENYLVLTDDARFVNHLNQLGLEALNINHLRELNWLADL